MTEQELVAVLTRFHRDFVRPEMEQLRDDLGGEIRAEVRTLRDETMSHFDTVYKRFDRLESEYAALTAAVRRMENG